MVALGQDGEVVERARFLSRPEVLRSVMGELDKDSSVTLEATGAWYWAADVLQELGLDVHLANPHKVRIIAESTIKNDHIDARALAHLTRLGWLPESRITPRDVRLVRERLRYRIALVSMRTAIKCRVHSLLAKRGIVPDFSDLFGAAGRTYLERIDLPTEYRAYEVALHIWNRHAEVHGDEARWKAYGKTKPADWTDLQVKDAKRALAISHAGVGSHVTATILMDPDHLLKKDA